ncbi:ABC transporter permease [Mesorhizobium shangrilense]|uniref:ABC transporter permease subunit n=1 Tax=Mesorhizobium shangrilense TaxID=460060 RepID=A0ABV2DLT8_9HYPH
MGWAVLTAICTVAIQFAPWLRAYPDGWVLPLAGAIGDFSHWFVANFKWIFRAISAVIDHPMRAVQSLLQWLPWPATITLFVLFALRFGSRRLALFTAMALGYMVIVGYWEESMNTLALVAISVPLSIGLGLALGVLAYRFPGFNAFVQPALDGMQTIPAFAYLIPILFLFGFGPVVGVIASMIFAAPPMVRNTILGLKEVPSDIVEAGIMSGCKPRQLFWQVEFPTALPQILVGVNQATMAALSMVIIAAIIGGFDDIGWEVLSTMRKAQFGESFLAGLVIVLLAMVLDRLSAAAINRQPLPTDVPRSVFQQYRFLLFALMSVVAFKLVGHVLPALAKFPLAWEFYPAEPMNAMMNDFIRTFGKAMEGIKSVTLRFLMLPIRDGLATAVNPFTWGFAMTATLTWCYALGAAAISLSCFLRGHRSCAMTVAVVAYLLYFGAAGTPWPVFIALITLIAYQAGGLRTAAFAVLSMTFILVNGIWKEAMLSVYLCTVAVLISFAIGGLIGIWAAHNDTVSNVMRPINDTLQTMPPFVLLIPALMLFKVGEFTALLAIISYAIVPPIRYVEHGLRGVPASIVEAAEQIGCTPRQILFEVKLPIALPVIMLGLNQTIMYGLAMLVIAALVGTQDLGQLIYLALTQADVGSGMVTGISMALIAMVADRILQALSRKWQKVIG